MAVQLIIDGQHITDVLAQVQQLADATRGDAPSTLVVHHTGKTVPVLHTQEGPKIPKLEPTEAPVTGGKPKGLSREEQDAAVEAMVEQGFKDLRFDQLTKGRQKDVEERLKEKDAVEDDLGNMFNDEEPVVEEITVQSVRDLMGKLGKAADGNSNQDNLLKIRDILMKFVPKGEEIKVGKIPADKLADVYAELKKLEA